MTSYLHVGGPLHGRRRAYPGIGPVQYLELERLPSYVEPGIGPPSPTVGSRTRVYRVERLRFTLPHTFRGNSLGRLVKHPDVMVDEETPGPQDDPLLFALAYADALAAAALVRRRVAWSDPARAALEDLGPPADPYRIGDDA